MRMHITKGKRTISTIKLTCTLFCFLSVSFLAMMLFFIATYHENDFESSTQCCCIKRDCFELRPDTFLAFVFVGGLACKLGLLE